MSEQKKEAARQAASRRFFMTRNDAIFADRQRGMPYRDLGKKYDLTGARCRQIVERAKTIFSRKRNRIWRRSGLARAIDPGGPRDVWLVFHIGDNQP